MTYHLFSVVLKTAKSDLPSPLKSVWRILGFGVGGGLVGHGRVGQGVGVGGGGLVGGGVGQGPEIGQGVGSTAKGRILVLCWTK